MALNDVIITRGTGGLSRASANEDNITGFISYNVDYGNDNIFTFYSIEEAEEAGFINTLTDPVDAGLTYEWYNIKTFFQNNPNGTLHVMASASEAMDFTEIETMQLYAQGKIRQFGIFVKDAVFNTGHTITIQGVLSGLEADHTPAVALYGAGSVSYALTALPDLHALSSNCPQVGVVIGQDGGNLGHSITVEFGPAMPAIGAVLGYISKSNVSESVAHVAKYNFVNGSVEFDNPEFYDETKITSLTKGQITAIHDKGYMFLLKHIGIGGSYLNDVKTATVLTDDFFDINSNRTIQKAIRGVRSALLPYLNSKLEVDPITGKVSNITCKRFENAAAEPLINMIANDEIVGQKVFVNPDQNVLSTSKLSVTIKIVPFGIAREIDVVISLAAKL